MRGFFNTVVAMVLSLAMLVGYAPLTALAEGEKTAQITIKYRDEENNEIRADKVITETYSEGGTYTVPDSLKADFAVKTESGSYNLYKFNSGKSDSTALFADQMTLTLVFNNTDSYAFYEDFEEYTVDTSKWHQEQGSAPIVKDDKTKYLCHSTGSGTTGGYMTFDEVDTTDKTVKITFDVKLTAPTGNGESQFTIGNTTPSFDSSHINYGAKSTAAGHIIHMSLQNGAFKVNGTAADAGFIGEWMHVDADVDFGSKAVNVKLTNDSGKEAEYETTIFSTSYENNLGSFYMRSGGANGTLSFDNLRIKITGNATLPEPNVESNINYKSVYAFGDSIVYGHNTPQESFMQLIANDYAVNLNMMAKNGATIIKSDNHILTQIKNAPSKAPDFVVFDGYTNDAYDGINYGTPKGAVATAFDNTTFCGGFEEILYTMKQKWPESKIVFVTIHKSGARDFDIQTRLHELTVQMCEEWGVSVVDMFKDSALDTRNADEMAKYIINGSGSHPNKLCCETYYIPAVVAKLEALVNGEDEPDKPEATEKPTATEKPAEPKTQNSDYNYVSFTEGHKIVGYETSLHIQYGTKEDKSVIRAIGDLAEDIKAVTGKQSTMRADDDILLGGLPPHGIIYDLFGPMCVVTYDSVPADSTCYVAAYNADGSLNTVTQAAKANYTDENGNTTIFEFDEAVERPALGSMKAFVWDNSMKPVTDEVLDIESEGSILVIGTLGTDSLVDKYAETNENIAALEGKRESFTVQEVNGDIVIAGSDKRGTIYGIYDFCEKMGVSPWEFWADVEPEKKENLYINLDENGYTEGEPSVEYRGIFLNDEFNLNQWTNSEFAANMNSKKYEKVYELILRLKMNTLWPAMHQYSTAFHNVPDAAEKADEYGVVIGSSHAEPLLRNNLGELNDYQDAWEKAHPNKTLYKAIKNETGNKDVAYYWTDHDNNNNPVDNKEFLTDYWRDSVKASGQYDNIYTLGMRGVHDGSFQTNMDYATALNEIIATQYKILKEEIADKQGIDVTDIPKVFIPYKDIQSLYNQGKLSIPDDVTIMWTDDNYGYMRQNTNDAEREKKGRGGVYYHVSYYGWPTSYLWISSTQPGLIREQLTRAYDMGADKMWILNVGDLKPAEKEIEYYARLSRDIEGMNKTDISDVYKAMAKRDFGFDDTDAAEYADIMDTYYELANSKRPEFYRTNDADNKLNISVTAYGDEGERYINRYKDITERAEALYEKLPESKKPSFFELALYPIRSAKNMAVDFVQSAHATLYNEQGRGGAINKYADEANAAAKQIEDDTATYNTMLSGKWSKMMVINPSHFTSCDARLTTDLKPPTKTELDYTDMAVSETEISLSKYDSYAKYIDISNTGYGSFDYEITTDNPAITLSKTSGTVYSSERVYVTLDASKATNGASSGTITVSEKLGENTVKTETIDVSISNPADISDEKTYVEVDGTVSVEAEHYTSLTDNGDYKWQVEKDFGRSGDSLKIYPNLSADVNNTASDMLANSAVASYDIYFENTGTYNVNIYRMPTLNERGTCRIGIGLDGNNPTALGGNNKYYAANRETPKTYA